MIAWTLDRVATALGETAATRSPRGQTELTGITTDTRRIEKGQLFVALVGENFDGHDFVAQAVERRAAALLVSRDVSAEAAGIPVYRVPDTLVALGRLASFFRRSWGGPVVMVAGSNGKTTTKDLVRAALSPALAVHATSGNLNNRIGVPLTLLSIPPGTEIAVIEAGTNMPGEIAILRAIMDPDISVVTSVSEEHLEGLGSIEGVLAEEAEAFDGVRLAIAPAAQPEIAAAARGKSQEVITAGLDEGDVRPDSWSITADGTGELRFGKLTVRPPLRGAHNLSNAMLAFAVAESCGVSRALAAGGIEAMAPPRMRVGWEQHGRVTLINDAYNANPGSARAAIDIVRNAGTGRQRVIVLGTMRELGLESSRCHDEISRIALDSGADIVAGVGEFATSLERVARSDSRIVTAPEPSALWAKLVPRLEQDAVILLKASRGVQLERLVPDITNWATT